MTEGATVDGKIEGSQMASITINGGSTVTKDVIVVEPGSTLTINGSTVQENIKTTEINTVLIEMSTIGKDLVSDKDSIVEITDTMVSGKIEIKDTTVMCTESGNSADDGNSGCPI